MTDNLKDNNNKNKESDVKQYGRQTKVNLKNLIPNQIYLSKEEIRKNKLFEDINNTLKLLDIDDSEDNGIENFDLYFRNDPKYQEMRDYIVGEELGNGMFSYVKEYVHKFSLKRFAAKVMNKDRIARRGQNYLENITLEINLVRKLNHKNVIHIFDFFSIESHYYLILEYCYAVLDEYLIGKPRKKLPKSQSHLYFCQLIEGLEYLHSIGIIHRDIKPANILVNTSNQIKITDFGVCYILDKFNESDLLTSVEGTPYYTPPEIFEEECDSYSGTKFDIWSSAVTLYEMITGQMPFDDTELHFFDNILKSEVHYPKEILDDKQLLNLLQKMFIKDFNKRITIDDIKRHPWFVLKHSHKNFRSLPPKESGDVYRSLSIMPYIQNYFYSLGPSDEEQVVSKEEFEESSDRTPNIRNNRLLNERIARNRRKTTPFRKLIKLQLGAL